MGEGKAHERPPHIGWSECYGDHPTGQVSKRPFLQGVNRKRNGDYNCYGHQSAGQRKILDRSFLHEDNRKCVGDYGLMIQEKGNNCTQSLTSSIGDSTSSDGSSSSLETRDDACSSAAYSPSSNSSEDLYDLSELRAHLPIKRGLSKYYRGKSESFTNLSSATTIDDLPKKERPQTSRKKKSSRRNAQKKFILPNPVIRKKTPGSFFPSSVHGRRTSLNSCGSMPPLLPLQHNLGCN